MWRDVRHEFVVKHGGRWQDEAQKKMIGMRTEEWASYIHDDLGVTLAANEIAKEVVDLVKQRLAESMPIIPGAGEALERLASRFCLGLATSAALPVAQMVLKKTGWERFFAVVVSADQVARGKPAPDVYLRTLELLEADASRTAAVEDSANGIRSAHAAGLAVVAIPNREFPPDQDALSLATRVLNSISKLNVDIVDNALKQR